MNAARLLISTIYSNFPIKDVKMGAACQHYRQEKRVEVFGFGNTWRAVKMVWETRGGQLRWFGKHVEGS